MSRFMELTHYLNKKFSIDPDTIAVILPVECMTGADTSTKAIVTIASGTFYQVRETVAQVKALIAKARP